jgi:hypothetical protein
MLPEFEPDELLLPDDVDEAFEAWRSGAFDDFDVDEPVRERAGESDVPSDVDEPGPEPAPEGDTRAASSAERPSGQFHAGSDASATGAASDRGASRPPAPAPDQLGDDATAAWVAAKPPERPAPVASPESIDGAAAAIAHARAVVEPGPLESLFSLPPTPEAPRSTGVPPLFSPPGGGAPEAPVVADPPSLGPEAPDPPSAPSLEALPLASDGAAQALGSDVSRPARSPQGGRGATSTAPPRQITDPSPIITPAPGATEPDTGSPPPAVVEGLAGGPAPHRDETLLVAMTPQLGLELGVAHDRQPAVRLTDLFVVPPFSTLDTKQDYWAKRKRAWLTLGIQSEVGRSASPYHSNGEGGSGVASPASVLGRSDGLTLQSDTVRDPTFYAKKRAAERAVGRELSLDEFRRDHYVAPVTDHASISNTGTSIFDPVLCEVAYRWFSPPGGLVLDPFAGGSVRGVVASVLGRRYVGVELRSEQVAANRRNAGEIVGPEAAWDFGGETPLPRWVEGSATDLRALEHVVPGGEGRIALLPRAGADLIFTCPPYADLEVYSDDPRDLSTAPYATFRAMLASVMAQSAELLHPDRFAVWVVGEARDKAGYSYGIVADTVAAARAAGLGLYNEAILETAIASAAMRATKQHLTSRKLVRVHQHVLVFCNGDPRRAAAACGDPQLGGST